MKKLFIIFSLLIFGFVCFAEKYAKQGNSALYANKHIIKVVATDYYNVSSEIRERYDLMLSKDVMRIHYKNNFDAIEQNTEAKNWCVIDYVKYNGEGKDASRIRISEAPEFGIFAVKFLGNKQLDNVMLDIDIIDIELLFGKYDLETAWNKLKRKGK